MRREGRWWKEKEEKEGIINSLLTLSLNELELICLHTFKWFQVLLTLIILFNINPLFAHKFNGFKYCSLNTIDPQLLSSNAFEIK